MALLGYALRSGAMGLWQVLLGIAKSATPCVFGREQNGSPGTAVRTVQVDIQFVQGRPSLARVGILNDRCREMAKMLDLQAGRGCCLILAWSQRPIDRQNLGTSPFLRIRRFGFGILLFLSPCPTPYSHLICLGGKAKVRRNICLVHSALEPQL